MKKRFKNKLFLLAFAGLLYQVLHSLHIDIAPATYQTAVDLISYLLMGVGIYHTFESGEGK